MSAAAMVTVSVTLSAAGVTALATVANAATPQRIGTAPAVPHGSVATGVPAGTTMLHLDVELAPRDKSALDAFADAVSDPKSAEYKQYLAKGQFAADFGPTPATIAAVTTQLRDQGLTPGTPTPDGLTIPVTATVAQAGTAFGTGFRTYRLPTGKSAFANTAAPELPSSVAGSVTAVVGLDNVTRETSHLALPKDVPSVSLSDASRSNVVAPHTASRQICSDLQQGFASVVPPLLDTRDYWEPGSLSAANAYNTQQLYTKYGNTGNGVTVGLFELETFSTTDIAQYNSCFGTNPALSTIKVDGGPTLTPANDPNDPNHPDIGLESALDIEAVAGMAPGAAIDVYQGPDQNVTDQNVLDVYQRMVTDDAVQVISTSWGDCEPDAAADPGFLNSESTIFAAAAAQGQSVIASTGDQGSTDCWQNPDVPQLASTLAVDDPAGQEFVTAAGGTRMQGTAPTVTTTWNSPNDGVDLGAGTGGGVSTHTILTQPGNYQANVQGAGYANGCGAGASTTGESCRQVPDISALADRDAGYVVAYGSSAPDEEDFFPVGGTSLAAPLIAAMTALADSSTACAAGGSAGFLNPTLYTSPQAITDVTTGNNDVPDSGYSGGLYVAGTGYDLATGLGTPKAPELVEALCNAAGHSAATTYVPVTPSRLLDTRNRVGVSTTTPVGANGTVKLQITGAQTSVGTVPTSGVSAVVLNVTAVSPTVGGFLTVFPDGTARPISSSLNFTKGETIPNLVTVPVGSDGAVRIFNLAGTTHVLADIEGYYTTDTTTGSRYDPVTPVRLLDTRNAVGVSTRTPIGTGGIVKLPIQGTPSVPAGVTVTAVVLNVTAVSPTANSFLSVFPDGGSLPGVSNLNFSPGETIPNLVTVAVGSDGAVDIFNHVGTVHALADLAGYYTDNGAGAVFHPTAPHRLIDTRNGTGVDQGQVAPIGANGKLAFSVGDDFGLGNAGPVAGATGLVLNVTATASSGTSFLTVFPSDVAQPSVSNLNFTAGQTIPNAVLTGVDNSGPVDFFNHVGTVQVVVDMFGYFGTS